VLREEGARVTLHYNTSSKQAQKILDDHKEGVFLVQGDMREEEDISRIIQEATKAFGRIDGMVANAGIWPEENLFADEMELEQWENTLKVNLTGVFLMVKEYFKHLRTLPDEKASIVMIGSTAGKFGEAGHADYSASKAAMHGLTRSWKNEIVKYATHGRINTVGPGWVKTPMAEESLKDTKLVTKVLQTIPLRKVATARDIADIVVFLLSERAGHINGQTIMVDGGMEGRILFEPDEIDVLKV
jgi:NAD(P)-dependent dehydrogenase (short-subunit alcohol dehydrogenase family)